ncbi:hypothetical protein AVEN_118544-1 [Araneus ventricosus]|uniref:Uncharacterized protein n=1 Tax=Araneus ventricosus TaxID=182803 RepID=A0A4Y2AYL8_ARAVE|nr:hypothetical protein AVEN_118544-1 [Araneus ventricosus]
MYWGVRIMDFEQFQTNKRRFISESLLSNKLSGINIAKLIAFLNENENLIKQPPDATSSSDSDPDFSPSLRSQTYGLRPSRGSIPRTFVSPPTSI